MNTNKADVTAIVGKGLVGAIPFVGPLAAEIVGSIIPNQRIDRLESLVRLLEAKIQDIEKEKVKQRIVSPEYVDLMEDGFWQAARALSEERKDYIASLLKNGLTDDELKYIEYKRLMFILGELNDIEILILKSKSMYPSKKGYKEFWETHKHSLVLPFVSAAESTQEKTDKETIHKTYELHLTALGLLKVNFKMWKMSSLPEFDRETGMIKAENYCITRLGRLLLRSIDQADREQ